ncbi:MAG TPA: glycosyltransferase, partial [Blastocatellia bacterium]|nr:glycosyltransferase [Blastocatellia bacterium]
RKTHATAHRYAPTKGAPPEGVSSKDVPPTLPLSDDSDYNAWLQQHALTDEAIRQAAARAQSLKYRPLISIVMPVYNVDPVYLEMALKSVEDQVYPEWELCVADDLSSDERIPDLLRSYASRDNRIKFMRLAERSHVAGATNAAIRMAQGEFLAFLDHDDELIPTALLEVAELLQDDPTADVIYSDHDIVGEDGLLRAPNFKPAWSPELLLSYMYFGHLKVYRAALVRRLGGLRAGFEGSADYDLALRLVELTDRIRHIPKVLYHWRAIASSMAYASDTKPYSFESGRRAVQEALDRTGITGTAIHPEFAQKARVGIYKVRFRDTEDDPVTIIIPTRDKCALLKACVESIERLTLHRAYEILIIDNESQEPETLDYLSAIPHRVLRFATPAGFSFSEIVNFAVAQTVTEFFVLLNNDTEVIAPGWLDEMVGYGRFPGVGAVGAKLVYGDHRIQHAGVILGVHGLTGHAAQPFPDAHAPLEYGSAVRNYLAVTAACMLSRKTVFEEVGGFNARDLKVAWNDVDYCLRLRDRGYRIVMNPHALLYHLESQSRGDDKNPAEVAYMKANWQRYIDDDPYFNVNFSRANSEFRVKSDPEEARHFHYR